MLLILIKNVRVSWVSRCIKIFLRVPTQSLGSLEQLITCVAQYSQKNPFKFHHYLDVQLLETMMMMMTMMMTMMMMVMMTTMMMMMTTTTMLMTTMY